MSRLVTEPKFQDGDAFYAMLVETLEKCGDEEGIRLLMRLALILANHIGDKAILEEALALSSRPAQPG